MYPTATRSRLTLAAWIVLVASAASGSAQIAFYAPAEGDLVPSALSTSRPELDATRLEVSRDPVRFAWALDSEQVVEPAATPFTATSTQYWMETSAEQLRRGLAIATVSPGALVRINPIAADSKAVCATIAPTSLTLTSPTGASFDNGDGMDLLATAEQLKEAGTPFPEGTSAFRIRTALGAGMFAISAPGLESASGARYLVHVFEPASDLTLRVRSDRADYFTGDRLTAALALEDSSGEVEIAQVQATIVAPDGARWPARLARSSAGSYRLEHALGGLPAPAQGLWEVQVEVTGRSGDLEVRRGCRTAFAHTIPTARLTRRAEPLSLAPSDGARAVAVRLELEAAAPGRYEVRGVLYGSDPQGGMHAVAVAHSAAWLEAGPGWIDLAYDADIVSASALGAPFEVRDLRLLDQGRMGLLHRQARGLWIGR